MSGDSTPIPASESARSVEPQWWDAQVEALASLPTTTERRPAPKSSGAADVAT